MTQLRRAPLWAALSATVVKRLPLARYRAMNLMARVGAAPFVATMTAPDGRRLRFECDLRNGLAREVFFTGRYEPQETALLGAVLGPGAVFIDVGAHWGYFSLLAAALVGPAGRVLALEAHPAIHRTLATNVALNGLAQLTAQHIAVAAGDGTVSLAGYDEAQANWGISRIVAGDARGPTTVQVPSRALDDLLDAAGVGAVELVKMDIEGAEGFALQGMAHGLTSRRYRRLLLELHPAQLREHGVEPRAIIQRLLDAGYRGFCIDHSPAAFRRAAYARRVEPASFLSPLDPAAALDAWPHALWLAPGVTGPSGAR